MEFKRNGLIKRHGFIKRISREIGDEAARQVRGFPKEIGRQIGRGWGSEFAHQIFGVPRSQRRNWSR
jgi:hypothetical protein